VSGPGAAWADAMAGRLRQPAPHGANDQRDMAALMLARVAQLHDSRFELVPGGDRPCVEWHFPLVIAQ
jgi:hypothetical protein